MATLLESWEVGPPPGAVAEQSLPLTFLDIKWLFIQPIRKLLFYDIPNCSKPYFLETLIPKLKQSLSISLKHFFPLAGRIVRPGDPDKKPVIRYRPGDSIHLALFESADDFDDLVGNHARDSDKFYDFIPQLQLTIDEESNEKVLEPLAIRVTLFPGRGVCVGISNHHSVGDATSIAGFMKFWALINNHGSEDELLNTPKILPVFDRSLIKYRPELDSVLLTQVNRIPVGPPSFPIPTNRVRATFVLTQSEIKKLKDLVQARYPGLSHVSSFVVTAAYVWNCIVRSGTERDDDGPENLLFAVDARARINPPVPGNYFGNCLSHALARIRHRELAGEEGFLAAAAAISEEIERRVVKNEDILGSAENWMPEVGMAIRNPTVAVSGSAKVDLYGTDFGWGRARKLETLSIDGDGRAMALSKSRDCEGGLEITLSLPKLVMDEFAARFSHGIIKDSK